jgi:CheY-like chemotaxis protein
MKRIMIVEDDKDGAVFLKDCISMFFPTWEMSLTGSGREAITKIQAEKPDVVLLDIALNDEIDGISVIKAIAKTDVRPRFILYTALGARASHGPRPGKSWREQLEPNENELVMSFFDKSAIKWSQFIAEIAKAGDVPIPAGSEDL